MKYMPLYLLCLTLIFLVSGCTAPSAGEAPQPQPPLIAKELLQFLTELPDWRWLGDRMP